MAVLVNGNEIVLSGTVGDPTGWGFFDDTFSASDVIVALAQVGNFNDVTIRLNSGGGIATEGSAIHSAIVRHGGKKTVLVEGIAASAASIIAMAGDDVVMSLGSIMMIHDPQGFTVGTIADHQQQITTLTAVADSMATIYAAKSGATEADCRADMRAEIWMTADQAVAKGYADRIDGAAESAQPEPAPFNYRLYAHAPERIVALADARHWERPQSRTASAAPDRLKDHSMSNTKNADAGSAPMEDEIKKRIDTVVTTATASMLSRSDAAEIAKLCNDGGVPAMAASLLAEGITIDQAKTRINAAGQIKEMTALARRTNSAIPEDFAATAIADGKSVEQVRTALFDQLVAKDENTVVNGRHRAGTGGADHANTAADARAKSKASMKAELKRQGLLPKTEA